MKVKLDLLGIRTRFNFVRRSFTCRSRGLLSPVSSSTIGYNTLVFVLWPIRLLAFTRAVADICLGTTGAHERRLFSAHDAHVQLVVGLRRLAAFLTIAGWL